MRVRRRRTGTARGLAPPLGASDSRIPPGPSPSRRAPRRSHPRRRGASGRGASDEPVVPVSIVWKSSNTSRLLPIPAPDEGDELRSRSRSRARGLAQERTPARGRQLRRRALDGHARAPRASQTRSARPCPSPRRASPRTRCRSVARYVVSRRGSRSSGRRPAARRGVDHVPEAMPSPASGGVQRDEGLTRRDPDAHLELALLGERVRIASAAQPLARGRPRGHGAPKPHDRVPMNFSTVPPKRSSSAHARVVGLQPGTSSGSCAPPGGEADEVAEEAGDDLPLLALGAAPERRRALEQNRASSAFSRPQLGQTFTTEDRTRSARADPVAFRACRRSGAPRSSRSGPRAS